MPHVDIEHGLRVQLATALRERDEARDDLGASHSRGAHLHCSKDRCDVAADGMALAAANARADAATTKAEQYERDWYAAKNDFGNAMAKSREVLAAARRECDALRRALRTLTYAWRSRAMASEDGGDKEAATLLYGCAAEVDAALAAPAAAAGEEGTHG